MRCIMWGWTTAAIPRESSMAKFQKISDCTSSLWPPAFWCLLLLSWPRLLSCNKGVSSINLVGLLPWPARLTTGERQLKNHLLWKTPISYPHESGWWGKLMPGQSYCRSFFLSSSWPEIQMRNSFCILATLVLVFERRQLSCLAFACSEASVPTQRENLVIQNPGERGEPSNIYRSECANQKTWKQRYG